MIKISLNKSSKEPKGYFRVHYGSKDYVAQAADTATFGINMSHASLPIDFVEDWQIDTKFVQFGKVNGNAELYFCEFEDVILTIWKSRASQQYQNKRF